MFKELDNKGFTTKIIPFEDLAQTRITCIYGKPGTHWKSGKHDGIDFVNSGDKTILSVSDGKVIRSGLNKSWGEYVVILMADGRSLVYAHMLTGSRKVAVGQSIKTGQQLGIMGSTGNSTGAHLHLELQKNYYQSGVTDDIAKFLGIKNEVGAISYLNNLNNEMTGAQALDVLSKKGVIGDTSYWKNAMQVVKNLEDLLIKIAKMA